MKQNKIECNLRAAHGFLSFCITRHGLSLEEFPELKACWDGIRKTPEYIDGSKHEQALTFGLEGHVAIVNISVFDQNGMYIRDIVRRMDVYQQNTGCGVRTINIWELQEQSVSVHPSTPEERAKVRLLIRKTKTCNTAEPYYITCTCEHSEHDILNTRCPVTIATTHKQLKWADFVQYVQPKKPDIVYGELPYFRRIRFIDTKDHGKGTYFSA